MDIFACIPYFREFLDKMALKLDAYWEAVDLQDPYQQ